MIIVSYFVSTFSLQDGDEKGDHDNQVKDFMSPDIFMKPFKFVAGNNKGRRQSRFDLLRKKSGLLNVLTENAARKRIMFKSGSLNTINVIVVLPFLMQISGYFFQYLL